jgi:type II secretory pathway pseudopilin PulG
MSNWWTTAVGHFDELPSRKTKSLAIAVLIGLTIFLIIGVSTCSNKQKEERDLVESLKATKDSIHHFKDQNGVLHNRVQSLVLTSNQFKEIGEQLGFKVDSMKKVIKNLNGLLYYYKGQIKEEGHFMFAMEDGGDSTTFTTVPGRIGSDGKPEGATFSTTDGKIRLYKLKTFEFSNKFLNLKGTYNTLTDSVKGKYEYKTGFELFVTEKKQGWFKPTLTYADIILTDPNASLINGTSLLIDPKKKWYDRRGVHILEGAILGGLTVYGASQALK